MAKTSRKNPARHKPTLTQSGTFQDVAAYQQKLKGSLAHHKVTPSECLWGLMSQAKTIPFGGLATPHGVSMYAIATAAFATTVELPQTHPLFAKGVTQHKMDEAFAHSAAVDAEGVHADYYVNAATPEEQKAANVLNMIWILCENSIYQGDFVYKLVNQLVLTGIAGFRNLHADPDRTELLFQTSLKTSAYDYLLALFGIWAVAQKSGNLNTANLIKDSPRKVQLFAACQLVIDELSLKHTDFPIKAGAAPYSAYSGKSRALALFSRWPFINLNDELYAIPGQSLLKIQLTSKLLTKALALARAQEQIPDTAYSQFIGTERLEPFFSELCDIWAPTEGHFPEYEYDSRTNSRSSDRIAFEKHGSSTVAHLFQVKLKALKEASHYGTALDPVLSDLKGAYSKLISQSVKFLYGMTKSEAAGTLRTSHEALSRRILSADKYCLVGVVPDLPSIFVFKLLRDRVMEDVEAALNNDEKAWYQSNLKGKFIWHIMELPEFETFLTIPKRDQHFYKALYKYLRDSQIDRFVIDSGGALPRDFRSYVISKFGDVRLPDGSRKLGTHQEDLFGLYDSLQADVTHFFFGNRCVLST